MTPELKIVAEDTAVVGEVLSIGVEVVVTKPTRVEFIDIKLKGTEGWSIMARLGTGRVKDSATFVDVAARVFGGGTLTTGTHAFAARFPIPQGSPPSHDSSPAFAQLAAQVHLHRAWRPDVRRNHWFKLRVISKGPLTRTPVVMHAGNDEELTVSLASSRLVLGETLEGSIMTKHLRGDGYRPMKCQLISLTTAHGFGGAPDRWTWSTTMVRLPAGTAGLPVPFQIPLPTTATPSFRGRTHERSWLLSTRLAGVADASRALHVEIPLELVDLDEPADTTSEVPQIGDQRILTAFAAFATTTGWRLRDSIAPNAELGLVRPTVEHVAGDAEVELGYAYGGTAGMFVVARLTYPSLGLALQVTPSMPLRERLSRDIEAGHAEWDATHHVDARFEEQTTPFLHSIVPELVAAASGLGTLARWNDHELVLARPVHLVSEADLAAMSGALLQLATCLSAARSMIAPPAPLTVDLDAWRALAEWLGGRLAVGDVSIVGSVGGLPVTVGVAWSGRTPVHLHASVGSATTANAELQLTRIELERPAEDARFATWPADVVDLVIAGGVASAVCAVDDPCVANTARARELVELLCGVLAELAPVTAPYR